MIFRFQVSSGTQRSGGTDEWRRGGAVWKRGMVASKEDFEEGEEGRQRWKGAVVSSE